MRTKTSLRYACLLIASLAALTCAPAAGAQYTWGTMVTKADYDYTPRPSAVAASSLCFVDAEGSGAFQAGFALYLDLDSTTCAAATDPGDIRLSPVGDLKAGMEVNGDDPDNGAVVSPGALAHFIRWAETGAAGVDTKDNIYLDVVNLGGSRIDVGDVRLTSVGDRPAGTWVTAEDVSELNAPLSDFSTPLVIGTANHIYKAGSTYYVNADAGAIGTSDLTVEERDVRLTAKTPFPLVVDFKPKVLKIQTEESMAAGSSFTAKVEVQNAGKAGGFGLLITKVNGQLVDAQMTPYLAPSAKSTVGVKGFVPLGGSMAAIEVGDAIKMVAIVNGTRSAPLDADQLLSRIEALERDLMALRGTQATTAAASQEDVIHPQNVAAKSPSLGMPWVLLLVVAILSARRWRVRQ